jgi:hypothetical protein
METGIIKKLDGCINCPWWKDSETEGHGCGRPTPITECEEYQNNED